MKHWMIGAISALAMSSAAQAADVMKMAVTTSFNNSGLADVLLPEIAADLDLDVQLLVWLWQTQFEVWCLTLTLCALSFPNGRIVDFNLDYF